MKDLNAFTDWPGKVDDSIDSITMQITDSNYFLPEGGSKILLSNLPPITPPNCGDMIAAEWWNASVNKADYIDYALSASCGLLTGILDIFFIGKFSLDNAAKLGSKDIEKFVINAAKFKNPKIKNLEEAIRFLEKNYPIPADKVAANFGGARQHHLRDFSHHPSLVGLLCSIFTQFTGLVIGTDTNGLLLVQKVEEEFLGENIPEKLFNGIFKWAFHLISDMAGSSATPGAGCGIPGPILSMLKEISVTPPFNKLVLDDITISKFLSKLYNGTLLAKRDSDGKILELYKFDLRTEIGILHEFSKQILPVLINETLVRAMYMLRQFSIVLKESHLQSLSDLSRLNYKSVIPFNNSEIRRMVTVATGIFTAIDLADASTRALIKKDAKELLVRINYVGIGAFAIALSSDVIHTLNNLKEEKLKEMQNNIPNYEEGEIKQFLALSLEQEKLMLAIQCNIVQQDIEQTKNASEKFKKQIWMHEWMKRVAPDTPNLISPERIREELYASSFQGKAGDWIYLLNLNLLSFRPYAPLGNALDKEFIKLKFNSKLIYEGHYGLSHNELRDMNKDFMRYKKILSGETALKAVGAVGIVAAGAVGAGLTFVFAPVIAPVIAGAVAGEAVAGLGGAALISASLATLGGGSLAAGGFGMVGGTAVITSGGSILAALGGTGLSAASSKLLSNTDFLIPTLSTLIVYCKNVSIESWNDIEFVLKVRRYVQDRIDELESIDEIEVRDNIKKLRKKKEVYQKCAEELGKLIDVK